MAYKQHNTDDGRVPLILYSGGMDSTLLLALETQDGKKVDTLYVDGAQAVDKIRMEFKARAGAIDALETKYGATVVRNAYEHRIQRPQNIDHLGFSQLLPWFAAAMDHADLNQHSVVLMGYVAGDQMVSQLHNIEAAWNALSLAVSQEIIPIKFPLKFATKREVYESLHGSFPMLKDHYWYCENPAFKIVDGAATTDLVPCDRCASCMSHNGMLYAIQKRDEANFTSAYNYAATRLLSRYAGSITQALDQHAAEQERIEEEIQQRNLDGRQLYLDFSDPDQQDHAERAEALVEIAQAL